MRRLYTSFDSERRLLAILSDKPYIAPDTPDDAPTLNAREYDRWFLLTLHEPEDWTDFLRSKRDDDAQHHRVGHDEPANSIYVNMSPVGPSGLTTTMPSQPYPPPQPRHQPQRYQAASPLRPPSFLALRTGYRTSWFEPPRCNVCSDGRPWTVEEDQASAIQS